MPAPVSAATRTAAVVYNPIKVDVKALKAAVKAAEARGGWGKSLWFETSIEETGGGATSTAVGKGVDVGLAAGGDGTVRAVAEALRNTGVPLAVVPSGTGN